MATFEDDISEEEKVGIASKFLVNAPPGEFNEVFNDVRILLQNDDLLKDGTSSACVQYNQDQYTSCQMPKSQYKILITEDGLLPNNRYLDPRSKSSFSFDHIRKVVSDVQPYAEVDNEVESWRVAIQTSLDEYVQTYYKSGTSAVYAKKVATGIRLAVYIESHDFQPRKFWNGSCRARWIINLNSEGQGKVDLEGLLRVQIHYYEDGNVQLMSSKTVNTSVPLSSEQQTSKDIITSLEKAEREYQESVGESFLTMSSSTFKALRRQLPLTRSKIDWNKILSYKIGTELNKKK